MRMLTKINRNFLSTSVLLFVVCSVLLFLLLRYVIHLNEDEDLLEQKSEIMDWMAKNQRLPVSQSFSGEVFEIRKTDGQIQISEQLHDTLRYDAGEEEFVSYRQFSFLLPFQNESYVVTIGKARFESDDLISTILLFVLLFVSALILFLYLQNKKTAKKIWLPFNTTLNELKVFELAGQRKLSLPDSDIIEFRQLNESLKRMTERINADYERLKQFTENASHEIQTPLSIIRSKIETLIQTDHIPEEQMNALQKINEAVSRLSKLNIGLLTLFKIENNQYINSEEIHLETIIRKKLEDLDALIIQKEISVSITATESPVININIALADLLFNNLIGNAIKHNIQRGNIIIYIYKNKFIISNSGTALQSDPELLFERFVKNDLSSDSPGLGLAIVKQICLNYQFQISFASQDGFHTITLFLH